VGRWVLTGGVFYQVADNWAFGRNSADPLVEYLGFFGIEIYFSVFVEKLIVVRHFREVY
jgi:hypothetical protein